MARKVFFSFHYERDIWRASQVRNCGLTKSLHSKDHGFSDAAAWEATKKKGDDAIRAWIKQQLHGTSVTVVLIGTETSTRTYIHHEIEQSYQRGNGLLGIYIHRLKNQHSETEKKGENPLDCFKVKHRGKEKCLSDIFQTYDWVKDNGYDNFCQWIEQAAKRAGR